MEDDLLITLEDLRKVRKGGKDGYCLPGLTRWANENGYSVKLLLKNGIRLSQIDKIDDPFVKNLAAVAKARVAKERVS